MNARAGCINYRLVIKNLYKGGFPLPRNIYVRTHVKCTRVNIIEVVRALEAMYERPRVKVERGSSFTFTHNL